MGIVRLIIWSGSKKADEIQPNSDEWKTLKEFFPDEASENFIIDYIYCSGHKDPGRTHQHLEEINNSLDKYLATFVINPVGLSNGLGPICASNLKCMSCSWANSMKNHPEDIWSNANMPSYVPHIFTTKFGNALHTALKHFAVVSPWAKSKIEAIIEKNHRPQ